MTERYIAYPVALWAREADESLKRSQDRRAEPQRSSWGEYLFTLIGLLVAVLMIAAAAYVIFAG